VSTVNTALERFYWQNQEILCASWFFNIVATSCGWMRAPNAVEKFTSFFGKKEFQSLLLFQTNNGIEDGQKCVEVHLCEQAGLSQSRMQRHGQGKEHVRGELPLDLRGEIRERLHVLVGGLFPCDRHHMASIEAGLQRNAVRQAEGVAYFGIVGKLGPRDHGQATLVRRDICWPTPQEARDAACDRVSRGFPAIRGIPTNFQADLISLGVVGTHEAHDGLILCMPLGSAIMLLTA